MSGLEADGVHQTHVSVGPQAGATDPGTVRNGMIKTTSYLTRLVDTAPHRGPVLPRSVGASSATGSAVVDGEQGFSAGLRGALAVAPVEAANSRGVNPLPCRKCGSRGADGVLLGITPITTSLQPLIDLPQSALFLSWGTIRII